MSLGAAGDAGIRCSAGKLKGRAPMDEQRQRRRPLATAAGLQQTAMPALEEAVAKDDEAQNNNGLSSRAHGRFHGAP